jgi:hypothetical protein
MSIFLLAGTAALAHIGVIDFKNLLAMPYSVMVIAFSAIFFTLFILFFFLLNLRRRSSKKKKTGASKVVTRHQGGLLEAASRLSASKTAGTDEISGNDVIYEINGVPFINSDLAKKNSQGKLNNTFVKLVESVTGSLTPPVP